MDSLDFEKKKESIISINIIVFQYTQLNINDFNKNNYYLEPKYINC